MRVLSFLFLGLAMTVNTAAWAQEDTSALVERLDRLERDVSFVQKQVYRGGAADGTGGGAPINNGQMQVRFSQIDEELRQIRGLIEQTQFQSRQTATDMKKLSDDVDFRLRAIEQKQAAMPVAATAPAADPMLSTSADEKPEAAAPAAAAATKAEGATATEEKPANYKPESKEKPALTGKDFPDANAHYSHAFKLLNEKKFSEAAASFDAFVKKYPSDPLTSNAFYWLGESQYVRSDFTRSAESFRKGFEVNPEGQKAPDNLYKLAMSLSQIKRKTEACVVLSQVIKKYGESAARTAAKAEEARTSLQCQ
jgi:tol-pal system protein YbgF